MKCIITGTCRGGDESPRFDVVVTSAISGQRLASIQSDGQGGSARVYWDVTAPELREAVRAWFAAEAAALYPDEPDLHGYWNTVHEAALVVVPARIERRARRVRRAS